MAHDIDKEKVRAGRLEKLRFWRFACAAESPVVTTYNSAPGVPPLLFYHGDWDNGGLYLPRFAAELAYPLVSIAPHVDPVPRTVRQMAEDRLPHLLAAQPQGPYRIGGFCNGATIAYETANLLIAAGHEVELVVLVAPPSLNAGPSFRRLLRIVERLLGPAGPGSSRETQRRVGVVMTRLTALRRLLGYSLGDIRTVVWRKRTIRSAQRRRVATSAKSPDVLAAEKAICDKSRNLNTAYSHAVYAYAPPPIAARVVVFGTGLDDNGRRRPGYDAAYDGRLWANLTPDFLHVAVPGDHYTCIAEHAPALAGKLSAALRSPRQRSPSRKSERQPAPEARRLLVRAPDLTGSAP